MKSFVGFVQHDGAPADARLLGRLADILRLPTSQSPELTIDGPFAMAKVAHRPENEPRFGRESVNLPGEFAFAIWEKGELFCARDRLGVRPFYYANTNRAFIFSDSLEAVIAHPDVDAETLDEGAVADYLAGGVSNDVEATIYAHVHRLPPAHTLVVRNGELTFRRYWTLPPRHPERDAPERLEAALKDAIRDRVGDRAVVFMSGGLDSTTLAALTREVSPDTNLLAFTSVYRTRIADVEETYANEAARSIGIASRAVALDDYPVLQSLEAGIWTPDPGPLLTAAMTRDLYAMAAEHAPIALHGHPADAVLAADLTAHLRELPATQRVMEILHYTLAMRRPPYFYFRRRPRPLPPPPPAWLRPGLVQRLAARPVPSHPLLSPIWSSYFEWAHPLLTRAPIELTYPWSDARVIEAAMALPVIPWLVDKRVLRKHVLRGRVSETIRRRRKTFLRGDPWTIALHEACRKDIDAASSYIDPQRFRETCSATGGLADATLRAVAFDHWLGGLHTGVGRLRTYTRSSA